MNLVAALYQVYWIDCVSQAFLDRNSDKATKVIYLKDRNLISDFLDF